MRGSPARRDGGRATKVGVGGARLPAGAGDRAAAPADRRARASRAVVWRVLAVVAASLALLRPAPASAHANLVQSDPPAQSSLSRAPAQVQLLFSEAVEPKEIEVSVLDRDRKPVDKGDAHLAPGTSDTVLLSLGDLPQGLYTISWKMQSAVDGHVTRGLVPFNIGDSGAVPDPLSASDIGAATTSTSSLQTGPAGIGARWLMLLAMLSLGGLAAAVPLLLEPAGALLTSLSGDRQTAVTESDPAAVTSAALRRIYQLGWLALALFLLGSVLLLGVDAGAAAGASLWNGLSHHAGSFFSTRRGRLWLGRMAAALAAAALLVLLGRRSRRPLCENRPLWWGIAAAVGVMSLLTSLGSHSASERTLAPLATAIDLAHLAAVALWIGGLVFLSLVLLPALRPLGGPARTRLLALVIPRFSTIAMASVGVILASGIFQTLRLVDGWRGLTEVEWGQALLVKLALFALLLALGAFNFLVVSPRMRAYAERADRPSREQAATLRLHFRRAVRAEVALALLALLAAGVLTGVSPTRATSQSPDGPFRPFVLTATTEGMTGRLLLSPGRIGNNRFDLTVQSDNGQALAADTTALLRLATIDQDTGEAEVKLDTLGPGRFTTSGAYLSTVGLWSINAVIRRAGHDDVTLPFQLSLTESTGRPTVKETRPSAPLARGREIYQQNCAQCHGATAHGDGPLAAGLRPPPVDLTVHVPLHSDAELTGWITDGIPRTAMPAWGSQFSPEEIQAVINYLRDLAK